MRRSKLASGIILLCFSVTVHAQNDSSKTYSLRKCVETALDNNLDIQQAGLSVQSNEAVWKQSRLEMFPDLNASVSHGINQGRSIDPFTNGYSTERIDAGNYNVSSQMILFNGFSIQNTIKRNALDHEAAKMSWQQAKDNITINTILGYLAVMTNRDLLIQAQKQVALTQQQVDRLDVLNKNGSIKPSDLSDMKGHLADDQLSLIGTRNALEAAKIDLCVLMNIPYDKDMAFEAFDTSSFSATYPDVPVDIYNKALTSFAHIRYAELKTQSAEKNVKALRGQLFPTLSLNGNANTNYSSAATRSVFLNSSTVATNDYVVVNSTPVPVMHPRDNYRQDKIGYTSQLNNNVYTNISLNLRIPIFNALGARTRVKLARIDAKNYSLQEQTAKTQLQQSVERSYLNMVTSLDRYKTLLSQVNSYQESFGAAEIRFNEGVGTSIDYLIARNNFDRATNSLIIAKYDYIVRTKILDYYQGRQSW